MVHQLTQDNFDSEIENSNVPVLVDMYSGWRGSCKDMGGILDGLADELKGNVKVCKIDIDTAPQIAAQFKVKEVPTCILFEEGDMKAKTEGLMEKHEFVEEIGIIKWK